MSVLQNAAERKRRDGDRTGAERLDRHAAITAPPAPRRAPRWWRTPHRRATPARPFACAGFAGFQAAFALGLHRRGRRSASVASSTASRIERAGMSISIRSPSSIRPIAPPSAASGETWPMERPEVPPENRPSVIEGAGLAEAARLQVARRIEHLLHAGPAARALVADHHDVAGATLPPRIPCTASSWLSKIRAGPANLWTPASTPAVFTMQPSRAMFP